MFDADADDARLGTFALTRLLVSQTTLPVIAAGGLMDGAGIRAALALGACAAQLGTAFIDTDESWPATHTARVFAAMPQATP
jgi:nitronate monooxygenase